MSSVDKITNFRWNSIEDAKSEYNNAYDVICSTLRGKGLGYLLKNDEVATRRGLDPGIEPLNATQHAQTMWFKKSTKYIENNFKIDDDFGKAISVLTDVFPYGSLIHSDLNSCINNIEFTNNCDRFNACINRLNSVYKPSNALDIDTIRRKIQILNDNDGFDNYYQLFTRYVAELRCINPTAVTDAELTEWVKVGIKNPEVFNATIGSLVVHSNAELQYKNIFDAITRYLQVKRENNPYHVLTTTSIRSDALVASTNNNFNSYNNNKRSFDQMNNNNSSKPLCPRCNRYGHSLKECIADKCKICRAFIPRGDTVCPDAAKHNNTNVNAFSATSTATVAYYFDPNKSMNQLKKESVEFFKQAKKQRQITE